MRFIRKNGRIIPIREDNATAAGAGQAAASRPKLFSGSHQAAFAAAGAAQALIHKVAPRASLGLGLGRGVASVINGIQHGRETHSVVSGLGRSLLNDFSGVAGFGGGILGGYLAVAGLRSSSVRGAAKAAGSSLRKAKGATTVMNKPNTGEMKTVYRITRKLTGGK